MSTLKGASRTFKGSPKLFEFILWEPGMLIPNLVPVQPVHVEIFYWISQNFELLVALKETSKHCQSHWDSSFVGTMNICSTFPDSPSNCCWDISLSARHVSGARGKNRGSPKPAGFIPWERQTSAPNFTAMPPIFVEIFQEQSCALTDWLTFSSLEPCHGNNGQIWSRRDWRVLTFTLACLRNLGYTTLFIMQLERVFH